VPASALQRGVTGKSTKPAFAARAMHPYDAVEAPSSLMIEALLNAAVQAGRYLECGHE
jgi:hypothetical protein